MASFHELNLPVDNFANLNVNETVNKVSSLIKLGYEVIALNTLHVFPPQEQTKKKKQNKGRHDSSSASGSGEKSIEPSPRMVVSEIASQIKSKPKRFQLLSRITVVVEDQFHVRELRSPFIQSFDILAVRPSTEKLFHQACTEMEIDVISLEVEERLPFRTKFKSVRAAAERGIYFEIYYAPAIRNPFMRRQVIKNGVEISRNSKGKNVILSSDANNYMEMRGPYDIANLGLLFGLTENQAKAAISKNCANVVLHAFGRSQTAKSALSITKLDDTTTLSSNVQQKNIETVENDEEIDPNEDESIQPLKKKKKYMP